MFKRALITLAAFAPVGGALYAYSAYSDLHPATDDAYIAAEVVHVAPQVSGQVVALAFSDQQRVQAGELLYRIDPRPFELALASARADLDKVRQQVAGEAAAVASAEAEVARLQVLLDNAKQRAKRNTELQGGSYVSRQTAEDAQAEERAAAAALAVGQAQLREARAQLGASGEENQSIRAARAALDQAQWRLDHTEVRAACSGRIAQKQLNVGDAVASGSPDFVLVCDQQAWVEANFKETQLARIQPGQPVAVTLDSYPGHPFHGEVESIAGASGVAFSLLPPQNASGNWVKVTQRVPVRVRLLDGDADHPLRVGTSASVRIDTRAANGDGQVAAARLP